MCRPREATSVQISTASSPLWNSLMNRSRFFCGTSPDSACALKPLAMQVRLELLGHALGVHEHHRAARVVLAQQADEQRNLFFHRREIDHLPHFVGGDAIRLDAHQLGIVHVLVGELEHALRQRGREQHGLALLRAAAAAAG